MLLEMATGDPNMPKGGHADDLVMLASTDAKQAFGPRTKHKRKRGEFGFGVKFRKTCHLSEKSKKSGCPYLSI